MNDNIETLKVVLETVEIELAMIRFESGLCKSTFDRIQTLRNLVRKTLACNQNTTDNHLTTEGLKTLESMREYVERNNIVLAMDKKIYDQEQEIERLNNGL